MLGAALCVVAPPVGVAIAAGAGAGDIVRHFRHTIPKDKLAEISELLESGQSGLIIVAVNHKEVDITPSLKNAEKVKVIGTKAGDLDAAFDDAVMTAEAAGSKRGTGHGTTSHPY